MDSNRVKSGRLRDTQLYLHGEGVGLDAGMPANVGVDLLRGREPVVDAPHAAADVQRGGVRVVRDETLQSRRGVRQ